MHPQLESLLNEPWQGASSPPRIRLLGGNLLPFEESVAAARTCYSAKGLVTPEEILSRKEKGEEKMLRAFARDLLDSGHHTVFQHTHFTFALEGVSRLFVWSFLHSHPFYNSEQVSQRFVHVGQGNFYLPERASRDPQYQEVIIALHQGYEELTQALLPRVESLFYQRFPGRKNRPEHWKKAILRKAQEVARYLLPQATHTHLHHTISGLTLMRYLRAVEACDAQPEARYVIARMVQEVLRTSPDFVALFLPPLHKEELALSPPTSPRETFDGTHTGFLIEPTVELLSATPDAESVLAQALEEIQGKPPSLTELHTLLDPSRYPLWCHSLNINYHHPILRIFLHIHYVFRKVLSLAADSQNQRHRFSHGSRPSLHSLLSQGVRAILPLLIAEDPQILRLYEDHLERAYSAIFSMREKGWNQNDLVYLLPNATAISIVESTDYLSLHHKHRMRLCYNAQEEIWRLSYEEARLVREVHPWLGEWLLPPCSHRHRAGLRPICPEGSRFCGERVWQHPFSEYMRLI